MDISECAHRDYESANINLENRLKTLRSEIEDDDKSLQAETEPLALPYFLKSQDAWAQYRESYCYYETYALGEASIRYINFWNCMSRITRSRLEELTKPNTDEVRVHIPASAGVLIRASNAPVPAYRRHARPEQSRT